jgi:hypothetical protein
MITVRAEIFDWKTKMNKKKLFKIKVSKHGSEISSNPIYNWSSFKTVDNLNKREIGKRKAQLIRKNLKKKTVWVEEFRMKWNP